MIEKKKAVAKVRDERISLKHSIAICNAIRGKHVARAKALLEGMSIGKVDLNGKYYTKASKKMLEIISTTEASARQKGMDDTKLFVAQAIPNRGQTFMRPRSKAPLRGTRAKATNLDIVLEER
jgi:ribosomal protein L22